MADEKHATNEELRQIIIGAIAAAPALAGPQPGVWIAKVHEAIPFVAAMMMDESYALKQAREVATAQVFIGVFRGYTVEQSSTRAVVEFIGERSDSKPETIRTHRTDTSKGKFMEARLGKLAAGDRVVLYKAMEEISSGEQAGRKARVLVHFETLPPRSGSSSQSAHSGSAPVPASAAASSAPPPPDPAPPAAAGGGGATPSDPDFGPAPDTPPESRGTDVVDAELADRFNNLPSKVKVNVVRRLRSVDIEFPVPQVDKIDEFIAIIADEESHAT